jgi:surface protein
VAGICLARLRSSSCLLVSLPRAVPLDGIYYGRLECSIRSAPIKMLSHNIYSGATPFSSDISGWNTARVTDMFGALALLDEFNRDLSGWQVSGVTDMGLMFYSVRYACVRSK